MSSYSRTKYVGVIVGMIILVGVSVWVSEWLSVGVRKGVSVGERRGPEDDDGVGCVPADVVVSQEGMRGVWGGPSSASEPPRNAAAPCTPPRSHPEGEEKINSCTL